MEKRGLDALAQIEMYNKNKTNERRGILGGRSRGEWNKLPGVAFGPAFHQAGELAVFASRNGMPTVGPCLMAERT